MNDEIKEMIPENVLFVLEDINSNILWNYITNLQQKNNNLTEDFKRHIDRINELTERNDNLQQELEEENDSATWWNNRYHALERENKRIIKENESLRTRIKTIKRLRKKQTAKKNKYKAIIFNEERALHNYKSRCEKAIEYMENDGLYYYEKALYNILVGSDNNE